jgi:hypothetical protein
MLIVSQPSKVNSTARLFADDCLLYRHIKTNEDTTSLQDDLNNLQDWERDWQMHINPDKCEVIRITTKRKIIPSSYFIHGKELNITSKGKYLGKQQWSEDCPLGYSRGDGCWIRCHTFYNHPRKMILL